MPIAWDVQGDLANAEALKKAKAEKAKKKNKGTGVRKRATRQRSAADVAPAEAAKDVASSAIAPVQLTSNSWPTKFWCPDDCECTKCEADRKSVRARLAHDGAIWEGAARVRETPKRCVLHPCDCD